MKKFTSKLILTAILLLSINAAYAGTHEEVNSQCVWWQNRYKAHVHLYEYAILLANANGANCTAVDEERRRTHEWGHAWATPYGHGRTSGHDRWWSAAGDGYTCPEDEPENSYGFSTSSFSEEKVEFDENEGSAGEITIGGIDGTLLSTYNSNAGAMYRITLWYQKDSTDTVISKYNILWDGGVYINNGKMEKIGGFANIGFTSETTYYEFENPETHESFNDDVLSVSASSLSISVDIKNDILNVLSSNNPNFPSGEIENININNIVVSLQCHTGYGSYTDPYEYFSFNSSSRLGPDVNSNVNKDNIEQESINPTFQILPNPASDNLIVNFVEMSASNQEIRIYSADGKLVKSITVVNNMNSCTINISEIPKGLYSIVVTSKNRISRKTFIKN